MSKPKPKTREQAQAEEHQRFLDRLGELLTPEDRADLLAQAVLSDNPTLIAKSMEMINEFLGAKKEEVPLVPIFALPPDFNPEFGRPKGVKDRPPALPPGVDSAGGVRDRDPDPAGLGLGKS